MKTPKIMLCLATALFASSILSPALAQNRSHADGISSQDGPHHEIVEVIVTADFRQREESETSESLTILGSELLESLNAQHLDDVLGFIPNINFAGGTSRARHFQIRGIGERSQFGSPINPSVGFIIDNVDFTGIGSLGTLIDISQIEVLRGPQGTRYGANALAGLINVTSKDPTSDPFYKLNISAGNYNYRSYSLILNQALTDNVKARLVLEQNQSDGFYENDFLNTKDSNKKDELTARAKVKIEMNDNWLIKVGLARVEYDNGYDTFSLDNSRTTFSDQPGKDSQRSNSISIDSKWSFEEFDMQLIVAAANSTLEYSYDEDWTFTGFHPFGYTSFDSYQRDKDLNSLEMRFISTDESMIFRGTTDWVVGLYRQSSQEDLLRQYSFLAEDYQSQYDFITNAIFFQLDTEFNTDWSLSLGARFENRATEFNDTDGLDFEPDNNLWGGRISLSRFLDDNALLYLSLSRGYKGGGFNTDGTLEKNLREFDSEYLWELEAGLKLDFNQLQIRAAIFYDKRHDQQVKSSFLNVRDDGSTEFIDFLGNAAKGTNLGLEIESHWYLQDNYWISANLGLLNAKFNSFINEFGEDLSGRKQSQAPTYNYQLGLNWQQNQWSAALNLTGKDEFFFSDRHQLQSTQYNLLNTNFAYKSGRYQVSLWGRNLLNKDYTTRGFGSFGNDPRKNYVTEPYVQFGEPRVVGISLSYGLEE
ncbi:MAG: iron complex outermembrane receptor protein [Candidatus Azotimanducaceae bacterium]|jgi:iron complex outermembrane receptor protein